MKVADDRASSSPPDTEAAVTGSAGRVRRVLKEAASWGQLRYTPYGIGPALIVGLISLFHGFDELSFASAGPDIARDLEVSLQSLVGLRSIVGFFAIFGALAAGWWADRHRRVPMFALGSLLSGIFSIISSRAGTIWTLGIPRVLDDVSDKVAEVPRFALVADYYPPESRGRVFAMVGTLRRVGGLAAPLAVGALIVSIGWRPTTFALGVPLVILGIVALVFMREPIRGYMERRSLGVDEPAARQEEEPQSFGEGWRTMWSVRTLRRVFMGLIWVQGGSVVFQSFFVFFLAERYGLDAFERALVVIPGTVLALASGFVGGGLIDVFTRRNPGRVLTLFGVMYVVAGLGAAGVAAAPPLGVMVAFAAVNAAGTALVGPAAGVVLAQVIPPSIRSQGFQVIGLSQLPALFLFTPIGLQIFTEYGFQAVMFSGVSLFFVGAVIIASAGGTFDLDMRSAFSQAAANEAWRKAKREGTGKMLVCRGIDVAYDGVQVVFDVDLDVEEGEIIALLGTNGAGKSTLLKAISGTQEASSGAIVFDGRDITHMPPHEIAARGVVHVPGGRGVFPSLSVRDNLVLAHWIASDAPEARERVREVFEMFPILEQRAAEPAGALSGGEQQMLSLAQAFLSRPRLLMIDELSLGLSPQMVSQLLDKVREINRRGVTIVIVEQSVNVALNIAERAVFMEKGEVKFSGRTADLLSRPDILRAVYVKGTGVLPGELATTGRTGALGSAVLEVRGLEKSFGGVRAVDDVSFDLRDGEVVGLIGPNGAGKTTVFDIISGFQAPDAGTVRYQGEDVTGLPAEELAKRKLIRRFQDARLFPSLTVEEALLVALEQRLRVRNTLMILSRLPGPRRAERSIRNRADRLIELLGLQSYAGKFVRELSTGVRRILDIGCVLAADPKVLMLDEPSTGIAQAEAAELAPLLREIRSQTGCSMLIIEHTMSLIASVSDELIALDQGRLVTRGTPDAVLNDERVIESYLGGREESLRR